MAASMKTQGAAEDTRAQKTAAIPSSSSIGTAAAAAVRPHTSKAITLQQQRLLERAQLILVSSSLGTAGKEAMAKVLAGGMVRRAAAMGAMMVMAAVAAAATPLLVAAGAARGQAVTVGIRAATEAAAVAQLGAPGLAQGMGLGRVAADQADLAVQAQGMAVVAERLVGYTLESMRAASQHGTARHTTVSNLCSQSKCMFFNAVVGGSALGCGTHAAVAATSSLGCRFELSAAIGEP
jgi:hypothetical protein